jgi:hypothetical protein
MLRWVKYKFKIKEKLIIKYTIKNLENLFKMIMGL